MLGTSGEVDMNIWTAFVKNYRTQHKIFIPSLENTFLYWAKTASYNFQIIGPSSVLGASQSKIPLFYGRS